MTKSIKASKTRQKFGFRMEQKITTLHPTCLYIIAMHSVCCCSLPVWRRSSLKKGTEMYNSIDIFFLRVLNITSLFHENWKYIGRYYTTRIFNGKRRLTMKFLWHWLKQCNSESKPIFMQIYDNLNNYIWCWKMLNMCLRQCRKST